MRVIFTSIISFFGLVLQVAAQTAVVPTAYTNTASTGTFLGPLTNSARTYQLLINESELTALVGKRLKGITFRLQPSAGTAWPASDITYSNYDIYLSGSVAPAQRSLIFANNVVGVQTQVRTGSLVIPAGSFTVGNSPNAFGSIISFTNPYMYNGGNLLVEIRQSGSTGTSISVEAVLASGTSTGYGTAFSACWAAGSTGTSGAQGNFSVTQFTYDSPLPVVLSSFTAQRQLTNASLQWRTASEINTQHFVIERSTDGRSFTPIAKVQAAGNSTTAKTYQYSDKNIFQSNADVVYYRLQIVDKDGLFKFSPVAIVNFNRKAAIVSVFPNPVKDKTTLVINAAQQETIQYNLTTTEGKIVQMGYYQCTSGTNNFSVNLSQLAAGNYYLSLKGEGTQQVLQLVKY